MLDCVACLCPEAMGTQEDETEEEDDLIGTGWLNEKRRKEKGGEKAFCFEMIITSTSTAKGHGVPLSEGSAGGI